MHLPTRSFIRALDRDGGVSVVVLSMAGICAVVLLVLFVHTLNVSIERGQALRIQQQAALRTPAARLAPAGVDVDTDVRVSSAR